MADLYLDPSTNDLVIEQYQLKMVPDTIALISQRIQNALSTYLGEWYLDRDLGVPYYEDILKKDLDLQQIRSIFVAQIRAVEGVRDIVELELELDKSTRNLNLNLKVLATTGETIVTEFDL